MRAVVAAVVCLWVLAAGDARAVAGGLDKEALDGLDAPTSRFKVSPEMVPAVRALLAPYDLDSQLPGGYVLDGLTVEKSLVRLILIKGKESFDILLAPPAVALDGESRSSASFRIVVRGSGPQLAAAEPLVQALLANDLRSIWPEAPPEAASQGQAVPQTMRKVHFTELMGDFLLVLLVIVGGMAAPAIRRAFAGRGLAWAWAGLLLALAAAGVRVVFFLGWAESFAGAFWTSSPDGHQVSTAWFLNTLGRFFVVGLDLVSVINIVLGTLTVVAVFLAASLVFQTLLPAVVAALLVCTFPGHVAMSCVPSGLIPMICLLTWILVAEWVYARTGEWRVRLLSALLCLLAVWSRPEAIVFVTMIVLAGTLRHPAPRWKQPGFLVGTAAVLAVLVLRAVLPNEAPAAADRFLSWAVEPSALFTQAGAWLLDPERVPLAAVALWILGFFARPWARDRGTFVLAVSWVLVAWLLYFHVEPGSPFQAGRTSLVLLPPLALLAGWGAQLVSGFSIRRRTLLLVLLVGWLVAAPLLHLSAMRRDYKASYVAGFLLEA
jgi:hypothetical protein